VNLKPLLKCKQGRSWQCLELTTWRKILFMQVSRFSQSTWNFTSNFHNIHTTTKWCCWTCEHNYCGSCSVYVTASTCLKYKVLGGSCEHNNVPRGSITS
jgi:hypothetical protein